MHLDDSLSMRDEGLSAYHQKHIESGALGVFLAAIGDGAYPRRVRSDSRGAGEAFPRGPYRRPSTTYPDYYCR